MSFQRARSDKPVQTGYMSLLRLPPKPRLIAGLACIAGGGVLTCLLWGRGVIWGLPLFAMAAGVFLSVSGFLDARKQKIRREYRESIRKRGPELLRGMLEAKRGGKNPLRWLNEQGIHDAEIRGQLVDAMNKRLNSARAPDDRAGP